MHVMPLLCLFLLIACSNQLRASLSETTSSLSFTHPEIKASPGGNIFQAGLSGTSSNRLIQVLSSTNLQDWNLIASNHYILTNALFQISISNLAGMFFRFQSSPTEILPPPGKPVLIYDNSRTSLEQIYASTNEFGDQITFSGNASAYQITSFRFEYFEPGYPDVDYDASCRVRFYREGADRLPGEMIYDSGSFRLFLSGYSSVWMDGMSIRSPSRMIWTVQFSNAPMGTGVLLYGPPALGSNEPGILESTSAGWITKSLSNSQPIGFGAQFSGYPVSP